MIPFRVYDRDNKTLWVVVNYHPASVKFPEGSYLVAKEDESRVDGKLSILSSSEIADLHFVDFIEEGDADLD